jgi:hypothetical protein
MGTYKVLQNIEAEDKLFGPLTLKQFIFAAVGLVLGYMSFFVLTKGLPFLVIIFAPPAMFFLFLAFPWKQEQPTEVWMLAKLRFMFKPRKRIWDQVGIKELVTITVPKKEEKAYTDGLSQTEVKSRLKALADTIDSRGWALKNAAMNGYSMPTGPTMSSNGSDRLVDLPQTTPVPDIDIKPNADVLDTQNNPLAQHLGEMVTISEQQHREQLMQQMQQAAQSAQQPTAPRQEQAAEQPVNNPPLPQQALDAISAHTPPTTQTPLEPIADQQPQTPNMSTPVNPVLSTYNEEQQLLNQLHDRQAAQSASTSHLKNILPTNQSTPALASTQPPTDINTSTNTPNPAILEFAHNDDLSVETIERIGHKNDDQSNQEVVVNLH